MIKEWQVINTEDPFERGPRAYFTGTGGSNPEDWFLEAAEFDVIPEERISVFSHPWLGKLIIQNQDTVILTLAERINSLGVKVESHDKFKPEDLSDTLISSIDLSPEQPRIPLVFYPSIFGYLIVTISLPSKPVSFSFYGLTERVQCPVS